MDKSHKIYEGKTKIVFATDSSDLIVLYYKDDTTCFNAAKKGVIEHKGFMNSHISARIFEFLESKGIPTHHVREFSDREILVKKTSVIPIEVVVRNVTAGSLCRRFALEEGTRLLSPIVEFCFKNDSLGDPIVNETHIHAMHLATDDDLHIIRHYTTRINQLLTEYFLGLHLDLIDFKLEFGRYKEQIILVDEVSPDTCRLWEVGTGEKLDKDRFRRDMGNIEEAYQEVLSRVSR